MASLLKIALFIAALIGAVAATDGGDVSQYYNAATFQCARNNGWNFVIVRSYCHYGSVDYNAPATLAQAKAGGIPYRDVYHFPCMGKVSAPRQVANNLAKLGGQFGMMWFNVEINSSPGCGYSLNQAANCKFLSELIAAGNSHGVKMGIFSSAHMWSSIMGNGCTVAASAGLPLWFAHWDGARTFSDFSPFGGWTKPAIKQYNNRVGICGMDARANWY